MNWTEWIQDVVQDLLDVLNKIVTKLDRIAKAVEALDKHGR